MITLTDVSRRYGSHWVLKKLSFTVEQGESVMLTGHNGSGKTTLLRILAGALQPTQGRVTIAGTNSKDEVRSRVALLSHQSGHYDDLSAEENLRVHAKLLGKPIDGLLARVGLDKRAKDPVRQFSAGMKKRLAIAKVMLKAPPIVLLDEPFGELDPEAMQTTEEWIAEMRAQKTTVVLATHWLDQGKRLTERELRLVKGEIV